MTPLHHAVQQKRLEMIKFLFEKGAKVDKEDDMGRCILHFSADSQDIECLELLVELLPKVNYWNCSTGSTVGYVLTVLQYNVD